MWKSEKCANIFRLDKTLVCNYSWMYKPKINTKIWI